MLEPTPPISVTVSVDGDKGHYSMVNGERAQRTNSRTSLTGSCSMNHMSAPTKRALGRSHSSPPITKNTQKGEQIFLRVPSPFEYQQKQQQLTSTDVKRDFQKTSVVSLGTKYTANIQNVVYPLRRGLNQWSQKSASGGQYTKLQTEQDTIATSNNNNKPRKASTKTNSQRELNEHFVSNITLNIGTRDQNSKQQNKNYYRNNNSYINNNNNNNDNDSSNNSNNNNNNNSSNDIEYDIQQKYKNGITTIHEETIKAVIREYFTQKLEGVEYNHKENEARSKNISKDIHDYLKTVSNSKFKFVVSVFIGEIRDDGIHTSSQCIWDPEQDNVVIGHYKNETLFAIAIVFTVSCE